MTNPFVSQPPLLNRPTHRGLWLNIAVWIGAVLVMNGLIFGFGWNTNADPAQRSTRYEVPGWIVGSVWTLLFGLMAVARWRLNRFSDDNARWWTTVLLINCLLYPLYTLALRSIYGGLVGNLLTIGLALFTIRQVWPRDRLAAGLLCTVPLWVAFATVSIFGQLGWLGT